MLCPSPSLWDNRSSRRSTQISVTEQDYIYPCPSAAWIPVGGGEHSAPPASILHHPPPRLLMTAASSHSSSMCRAAQADGGLKREVRYTLCPHIPSCHRTSPKGRIPPALGSSHPLIPGRVSERVGRWLAGGRGVLRWEDHTRPLKNGTFLHIVRYTSSRSDTDLSCGHQWTFTSLPCGWGDTQAEDKCVPDKSTLFTTV